jgi:hypothetical protein
MTIRWESAISNMTNKSSNKRLTDRHTEKQYGNRKEANTNRSIFN